jgi:hypothetical protein
MSLHCSRRVAISAGRLPLYIYGAHDSTHTHTQDAVALFHLSIAPFSACVWALVEHVCTNECVPQGGNLRWRPAAAHQQLWATAKSDIEAERAAALARSRAASFRNHNKPLGAPGGYYSRSREGSADGEGAAGGMEEGRWGGRGLKVVDTWVSSLTGGLQRLMTGILSRGESVASSRATSFKRSSSAYSQKESSGAGGRGGDE